MYKSSLFSLQLQPPPSLPAPALLAILSLAAVGIHTSAALGHPGRNSLPLIPCPCLVQAFCASAVSKSLLQYARSIVGLVFSPYFLVQADASFQLVSELPILPLQGNYM
jgi:hypothetical protein